MASHVSIATHQLERYTRQNEGPPFYRFLARWANHTNLARNSQGFHTEHVTEKRFSFSYSMNVAEQTLVVWAAFFSAQASGRRYTNMRCWQTIVDSWLSGGGTQPAGARNNLRYIAIHDIIEDQSLAAMEAEVEMQRSAGTATTPHANSEGAELEIETTSTSPHWSINPWIRCCERVAAAFTTPVREITVSRAWIQKDNIGSFHLIVELAAK